MIKELFLLRHGEAEHMVTDITGGWTDTPLTMLGTVQARRAAERLALRLKNRPFQFYTSDLLRARQTAEAVALALGHQPVVTAELREISNGDAAYLTRTAARVLWRPTSQPIFDWQPYPGAETWRTFLQRLTPFFERAAAEGPETALWVSHSLVIKAAIQWWLGFNEAQISSTHFQFDPSSITWLSTSPWGNRSVVKINDTAHLEPADGELSVQRLALPDGRAPLSSEDFLFIVDNAPLIAIDLLVRRPDGQVLLGLRRNHPAQGQWFVPGGRIYKDERLAQAFARITAAELGRSLPFDPAQFCGAFEHLYPPGDNFAAAPGVSTHYITLAYTLTIDPDQLSLPEMQHLAYRWWPVPDLLNAEDVHENTKAYFADRTPPHTTFSL